ncbi:MAG TPA: ATP-binding protein, partial [Pseudomonadota bacterium]|nr:ATP-binding protein [Pseudomonadota bacterium]
MNGIQAMPSGGKLIVNVAGSRDKQGHAGVTLSVKDSGTGIAPENLKRIFEPFFTTQSAGVGTGLGLSITEGIVRDHLGKIEVESDLGQGSTFRIIIPCEPTQGQVEGVK